MSSLENWVYDFTIKKYHRPLKNNTPIAIVDIDDKSLKEIGRWPWSRKVIADLVTKLYDLGATVVAFDVLFSEPEKNIAEEVFKTLPSNTPDLEKIKETFDYDALLAKSLGRGESVLATVFLKHNLMEPVGALPSPLLTLTPEEANHLEIPKMGSYVSNIALFENVTSFGGFINASPDEDGVLRFTPLLLRYENNIYPSLALKAVEQYLLIDSIKLKTTVYDDHYILEGLQLDNTFIPTDRLGRSLIPFRGKPYTFNYIPAESVLRDKIKRSEIANKIIFIGSSAAAISDIKPAAISPTFFGVEVHASIASGIIDHYTPYIPSWAKGTSIFLILILGLVYVLLIPRLGAFLSTFITISTVAGLLSLNIALLTKYELILPVIPPILLILILQSFDTIFGYFLESHQKEEIKSMFGQYVPPEYMNQMIEHSTDLKVDGESKELTVLFADIKNFTTISEKLDAKGIKALLNNMLTPMTQIIFDNKGTVDKYVGDMIMAFWGAPLEETQHAEHAVRAALKMNKELDATINKTLTPETQLHLRFGINTGIMNVGDMGSKFRRAYTVLGDSVNFASRLEQICKYYGISMLVGEQTWEKTKDLFLYRKIDKVKVKGKETAVNIYEPICPKEEQSPELSQKVQEHEEALQKYQEQDWGAAEQLFTKLQSQYPQDKELYQLYLDRVKDYQVNPPPQDWDGTYTFTKK